MESKNESGLSKAKEMDLCENPGKTSSWTLGTFGTVSRIDAKQCQIGESRISDAATVLNEDVTHPVPSINCIGDGLSYTCNSYGGSQLQPELPYERKFSADLSEVGLGEKVSTNTHILTESKLSMSTLDNGYAEDSDGCYSDSIVIGKKNRKENGVAVENDSGFRGIAHFGFVF